MRGMARIEGNPGQAVWLEPDRAELGPTEKPARMNDAAGIGPIGIQQPPGDRTAKEQIDLMEAGARVMKFVDQGQWTDTDSQPAFFMDFTHQVFGKGSPGVHPASGRAPKVGTLAGKRVDQQQTPIAYDDRTGRKTWAFVSHSRKVAQRPENGKGLVHIRTIAY